MSEAVYPRSVIGAFCDFMRDAKLSERETAFVEAFAKEEPDLTEVKSAFSLATNCWSVNYSGMSGALTEICRERYEQAANDWLWWYSNCTWYDARNESSLMMTKKLRANGFITEPKADSAWKEFGPMFVSEHRTLIQCEAQIFFLAIAGKYGEEVAKVFDGDDRWWRCPFI